MTTRTRILTALLLCLLLTALVAVSLAAGRGGGGGGGGGGMATDTDLGPSLEVTVRGATQNRGAWVVSCYRSKNVTVQWTAVEGAHHYSLLVYRGGRGDAEPERYDDLTSCSHYVWMYMGSRYSVYVVAYDADGTAIAMSGTSVMLSKLNGVVPGVALTDTHNYGTMDMSSYTEVDLSTLTEGAMDGLTFDGTTLAVTLEDGGTFTGAVSDDLLTLTPEDRSGSPVWHVSCSALKKLKDSGIASLKLKHSSGHSTTLATDFPFSGLIYSRLRASGLTNKDFVLEVSEEGIRVRVDGTVYGYEDGILTTED